MCPLACSAFCPTCGQDVRSGETDGAELLGQRSLSLQFSKGGLKAGMATNAGDVGLSIGCRPMRRVLIEELNKTQTIFPEAR
jgi:hypothetical protein